MTYPLSPLLPGSTLQTVIVQDKKDTEIPIADLTKKILSLIPIKQLATLRLTARPWIVFIDTHFSIISTYQYVFHLQKHTFFENDRINNFNAKNYLSAAAIYSVASSDFDYALTLAQNMAGTPLLPEVCKKLCAYADTRERLLKLIDFVVCRQGNLCRSDYGFIYSIIKKYFSVVNSLDKENRVVQGEAFQEALALLIKYKLHNNVHILIGLWIVETFPYYVKNQPELIGNALETSCRRQNIVWCGADFSFQTFLNFLIVACLFPEQWHEIPYVFERISSRNEALYVLKEAKGFASKIIIYENKVFEQLTLLDLLREAAFLPDDPYTYAFYKKVLNKKVELAVDFEQGVEKLLERRKERAFKKASPEVQQAHARRVQKSIEKCPSEYLSVRIYQLLDEYFPQDPACAKAYLRLAKALPETRVSIWKTIKKMSLKEELLPDLVELESLMENFEAAKKTFCSITVLEPKIKASPLLIHFAEQKDWENFEFLFKDLCSLFVQKVDEKRPEQIKLLLPVFQQVAQQDFSYAVTLAKRYFTGVTLIYCLTAIADFHKKQGGDFLPLVFETRSLALSLLPAEPQEEFHILNCLMGLLELQNSSIAL